MRHACSLLVALSLFSIPAVCQNTPDAVPNDIPSLSDGFYYKASQGWQKPETLSMADGGLKHMGKMFVPGLTPQMVWTFRGAESPVQVADKRPTFCIKELPALAEIAGRSGRDLLIVRFDKKKDHRELQTTNGGNMFTFKAGLTKDRVATLLNKYSILVLVRQQSIVVHMIQFDNVIACIQTVVDDHLRAALS